MLSKKPIKHKQSQFFTVMLVPYSSTKVKSIKIPHYILYGAIGAVVFLALSVFLYTSYSHYLSTKVSGLENDLEQTTFINNTLKGEAESLSSQLNEEKSKSSSIIQKQKDDYENSLDYYEDKLKELEEKIDELDKSKQEIYDKIAELNLPTSVTSSLLQAKQSSDYTIELISATEDTKMSHLDDLISSLDEKILNESSEYAALTQNMDIIKPYLDAFPSAWPVRGTVTSESGERSNPFTKKGSETHGGIDIAVPKGTSVKATGGGTVTFAGYEGAYGYLVIISHGYGLTTYYAHNSSLTVSEGDKVSRGTVIAKSGSTGRSTGPHVHYEVRLNGVIKNPRNYIKEK